LPSSDGRVEELQADVVHFVTPQAYLTQVPSIYQPLDLLHVHEPQQFAPAHRAYRERAYRIFCEQAAWVVAMTSWGRSDLADHYGIGLDRIVVVPVPPVVVSDGGPGADDVSGGEDFLLYPAQTWPHKNHRGLIDALAYLRERRPEVRVLCTGRWTADYERLAEYARARGVADRIQFVGYVPGPRLSALYGVARGVVFPSRFEGWGLPVVEAFSAAVPVACSDIPVLREVAGDAAIYFDPKNLESIASAMVRLWDDRTLRDALRAAGLHRVSGLTWARVAATFRALYRRTAGVDLTDEDRLLLSPPTLIDV
jgi:glycosyltransferase involved in cell wall biosynthesis